MTHFVRWGAGSGGVVYLCLAFAGCLAAAPSSSSDSVRDGGSGSSGTTSGSGSGSGNSGSSGSGSSGSASGVDASSGTSSGTGSGADASSGEGGSGQAGVDINWAQWTMPNSAADTTKPHPESYRDNGNGSVTDLVTGLTWQKAPETATYTLANAATFCAQFSVTGITSTWRLPSFVELESLLDYSSPGSVSIDMSVFPSTPTQQGVYWTSTPDGYDPTDGYAWGVFFDGSGAANTLLTNDNTQYVRCVTSSEIVGTPTGTNGKYPPGRYTVGTGTDTGTVRDNLTGLTWQEPGDGKNYTFAAAQSACTGGWRLPTMKELVTLMDMQSNSFLIDDKVFTLPLGDGGVSLDEYWSSDLVPGKTGYAYSMEFDTGIIGVQDTTPATGWLAYVRCVR